MGWKGTGPFFVRNLDICLEIGSCALENRLVKFQIYKGTSRPVRSNNRLGGGGAHINFLGGTHKFFFFFFGGGGHICANYWGYGPPCPPIPTALRQVRTTCICEQYKCRGNNLRHSVGVVNT